MIFDLRRFMVVIALMGSCATVFLTSCGGGSGGGGSNSNSAMNLAGTWTVTSVSTKGQAPYNGFSGTASVSQSGEGLGVNGATTFSSILGSIAVSQTGAALTGTFTNSIKKVSYNFIGTLSSGNFTITASTSCAGSKASNSQESTSITGTITSNSATGTYTISRGSGCYYSSDAGTFVATKK
jgi:hypothetical protein